MPLSYTKEFTPTIVDKTFLFCFPYKGIKDDENSITIYKKAIDWVEKHKQMIRLISINTNDFNKNGVVLTNGLVTVIYQLIDRQF